ncbi:hypothetical protein KFK09_013788 [Dendrobium nobile]|uniref:Uncharacterized protein n=1 Tax=Dendrobium nobile TaxID=94219 RepID=A0A8T3BA60_DENNO|nr:hypothetical protein KFK09_013788 [Dendrobium nobile]
MEIAASDSRVSRCNAFAVGSVLAGLRMRGRSERAGGRELRFRHFRMGIINWTGLVHSTVPVFFRLLNWLTYKVDWTEFGPD